MRNFFTSIISLFLSTTVFFVTINQCLANEELGNIDFEREIHSQGSNDPNDIMVDRVSSVLFTSRLLESYITDKMPILSAQNDYNSSLSLINTRNIPITKDILGGDSQYNAQIVNANLVVTNSIDTTYYNPNATNDYGRASGSIVLNVNFNNSTIDGTVNLIKEAGSNAVQPDIFVIDGIIGGREIGDRSGLFVAGISGDGVQNGGLITSISNQGGVVTQSGIMNIEETNGTQIISVL